MNTFIFGVITKRLEEIGLNVHEVFNMSDKQAKKDSFDDLYHYVRYTKPYKAELTMVALDADELMHYFVCCYIERYAYLLNA
ncbi:hypothetical protein [Staphylococcus hominis]|uniref:hypothetical protein n=1 Tax=Staphylococcus hominis TaxID=1290 RepID=UPI002878378C|nr:hypothetical protein [Staphylococcus hominis]MDS3838258.1 hypothetical protein [Staphylococcus hominis]MDS3879417.1 hypothetical protein [Staphylococcus hominis]